MSARQLVLGASGIYISYLASSIIAQRLYSTEYPSSDKPQQKQKFSFPCLVVWFSSLLCAIFGVIRGMTTGEGKNPISKKQQITLGLLYTTNILSTNYSLLYISYLAQVIGRNCRYLMVVVIGAFFSRVKKGSALKLNPKKVIAAVIITISVTMFTLGKESGKQQSHITPQKQWIGYVLIFVSVIADALFSDSQAYAKANFHPSANHLFTSANFLTFLYVLLFSLVEGQLFNQFAFVKNHPSAFIDLLAVSVLQVFGQVTIYYVIARFKQHVFPLISTTRKVFTILLSIIIYGHSVTIIQQLSILLLFLGLAYQLYQSLQAKKAKQEVEQSAKKQKKQ